MPQSITRIALVASAAAVAALPIMASSAAAQQAYPPSGYDQNGGYDQNQGYDQAPPPDYRDQPPQGYDQGQPRRAMVSPAGLCAALLRTDHDDDHHHDSLGRGAKL
ncbi:hypothetical protein ACFS32_23695 [Novosphingobium pokkalii]|uniref:hypothetical protein n=1 Tax=Novosphingobium pokkalii TaxID=1770194 RepID=UPI003635D1FB